MEVIIDNQRYHKFHTYSNDKIYLGEERELINSDFDRFEYNIDDDIYDKSRASDFRIIWKFYSDAIPPIKGELLWEEIQQF